MTVDILERFGIIASDAQAEDFEKWMVNFTWSKYNDDKMNQRIIIENKSVLEIQDEYDLQLIAKEELDVQDESVCMNHGVSDLGFTIAIENGKLKCRINFQF